MLSLSVEFRTAFFCVSCFFFNFVLMFRNTPFRQKCLL